jgi:hypothetical protein
LTDVPLLPLSPLPELEAVPATNNSPNACVQ